MNNYLSDKELCKLVSYVEENEMINPPPDTAENIMAKIREQKKAYLRYCIRVTAAVAASILIIFTSDYTPDYTSIVSKGYEIKNEVIKKAEIIKKISIKNLLEKEIIKNEKN